MANLTKYTRTQTGAMTRHYERAKDKNGEYLKFGNQDIDTSKSHLNYNLAPERNGGQLEFIKQRTSEVRCLARENINVMCSWIITAPEGLATGREYREKQRPLLRFEGRQAEENLKTFFEESYKFLNERYAKGSDRNVISAYVHMDETTPHMHYAFVPVVWDSKKGIDKVAAKTAVGRLDLSTFHPELERHMANVFGCEIGILNDATKEGNKSIEELKQGTAKAELEKMDYEKANLEGYNYYLRLENRDGEKQREDLTADNQRLELENREKERLLIEKQNELKNIDVNIAQKRAVLDDLEARYTLPLKKEIEALKGQKNTLKTDIKINAEQLKNIKGVVLNKNEVNQIQQNIEFTAFGNKIKIKKEDYDNLVKTALDNPNIKNSEKIIRASDKIAELKTENEELRQENKDLKQRVSASWSERTHYANKSYNLELKIDDIETKMDNIKKQYQAYQNRVGKVLSKISPEADKQFRSEWQNESALEQEAQETMERMERARDMGGYER